MAKPRVVFAEMLRSVRLPAELLKPYDDAYLEKLLASGREHAIAFIGGLYTETNQTTKEKL